jgi:hypothetical protein
MRKKAPWLRLLGQFTGDKGGEIAFTDGPKLILKYRKALRFSAPAVGGSGLASQRSTANKKEHIRAIASWDQT